METRRDCWPARNSQHSQNSEGSGILRNAGQSHICVTQA